MKKSILCVVFLLLGILLAPTVLLGQTHASDEEIALGISATVKPPLPRSPAAPLPVSAWLNLSQGKIYFAFTEALGTLTVLIEDEDGEICAQYTVNGNAATDVVALPILASGTYKLSIVGGTGNQHLYLFGYFNIP